jgi:hypothetical protein
VRFKANLPDGGALRGDLLLPSISISGGPGRPRPDLAGKAIAEALIPQLSAQLAPHLPPAAPARKVVQRGEDDRILGTREYPATPAPAYLARQIAERLAPSVAAEYAHAIRARYAAIDADAREAKAAQSAKPVGAAAKAQPAVSAKASELLSSAVLSKARDVAARLSRLEQTPPPREAQS